MKDVRASCGFGRQRPCIYSTAYSLSKEILFVNPAVCRNSPAPTLLASMSKPRLVQWVADDVDFLRKSRASLHRLILFGHRRRHQLSRRPRLSEDARAIIILNDVAHVVALGKRRSVQRLEYVTSTRRQGSSNVQCVLCMIDIMQAKYLCDKTTVLITDAFFANDPNRQKNLQSAQRSFGRIDSLIEKIVSVLDSCSMEPFFRGRLEEIIAGRLAVQLLEQMTRLEEQPGIRELLHRGARECAFHFCNSLHAYAEGSSASGCLQASCCMAHSLDVCCDTAREYSGVPVPCR